MRLIKCKTKMNFNYQAYSDIYINCITFNLYLSIVRLEVIKKELLLLLFNHDSNILC